MLVLKGVVTPPALTLTAGLRTLSPSLSTSEQLLSLSLSLSRFLSIYIHIIYLYTPIVLALFGRAGSLSHRSKVRILIRGYRTISFGIRDRVPASRGHLPSSADALRQQQPPHFASAVYTLERERKGVSRQ